MKEPNPLHPEKYVVLRHRGGNYYGSCFWTTNTSNNTHSDKGEHWYDEILFTDSEEEAMRACGFVTLPQRNAAMFWWNSLSSAQKTKICDLNTELVGSIRRWETLTGREIEMLYNTPGVKERV